ncbi:bifunctional 3-demethylubiquinone-9 3-methyltransferase/ 2-octaprenyl-6-hydroxy phenol methylase [compost metagenome]
MNCLLCQSSHTAPFKVEKKPERSYFHCAECDLIFMNPAERLTAEQEKARYDHHNTEDLQGYQAFLAPLVKDVVDYTEQAHMEPHKVHVLDYGCGPTAFLSALFEHKNMQVTNYDLFYRPDQDSLRRNYNVVTSTEVWEHFYNPREEISKLARMVKSGGWLAVMTSSHKGEAAFHDWHYRRDTTHVVFYSEKTMNWIAQAFSLQLLKAKSPYWIFKKI